MAAGTAQACSGLQFSGLHFSGLQMHPQGGSKPPRFIGWQRQIRFTPRYPPRMAPYLRTARMKYELHDGKNWQELGNQGLIHIWYNRTAAIIPTAGIANIQPMILLIRRLAACDECGSPTLAAKPGWRRSRVLHRVEDVRPGPSPAATLSVATETLRESAASNDCEQPRSQLSAIPTIPTETAITRCDERGRPEPHRLHARSPGTPSRIRPGDARDRVLKNRWTWNVGWSCSSPEASLDRPPPCQVHWAAGHESASAPRYADGRIATIQRAGPAFLAAFAHRDDRFLTRPR